MPELLNKTLKICKDKNAKAAVHSLSFSEKLQLRMTLRKKVVRHEKMSADEIRLFHIISTKLLGATQFSDFSPRSYDRAESLLRSLSRSSPLAEAAIEKLQEERQASQLH